MTERKFLKMAAPFYRTIVHDSYPSDLESFLREGRKLLESIAEPPEGTREQSSTLPLPMADDPMPIMARSMGRSLRRFLRGWPIYAWVMISRRW